ncbi:MAG: hypothetical protein A2Z64_03290 [Betaproteobacteria bacterium RIFCSPLOWO2_02_67_12]|nr:MAG: hypothetical protein A2Z64_03290 [Betaproteobacteria bacterium RIFCSPLOWO2_02_67_12]
MNAYSGKLQPVYFAAAVSVIIFSAVGVAAFTGHLPGATSSPGASAPAAAQPKGAPVPCADCGVIEGIRAVQVAGEASGLGAAAGGITGAIVGNQIGRGDGRTIATIAGAAGGAFAGNSIEKNMKKQVAYRITVLMADGSKRILTQSAAPAFAVGERVRVVNHRIVARV